MTLNNDQLEEAVHTLEMRSEILSDMLADACLSMRTYSEICGMDLWRLTGLHKVSFQVHDVTMAVDRLKE